VKNTERFSDRADIYAKYRPSYPAEALDYLYGTVGLRSGAAIADIGAGTGIFSALLVERGSEVFAVEPNEAMRGELIRSRGGKSGLKVVEGTAEETNLPDASVDFVTCAQSFHWFDRDAAKREFGRILRPGGKVALIWNSRLMSGTPFLEGYEDVLRRYGTDYQVVSHKNISESDLRPFFQEMTVARFPYKQLLDLDGLFGRVMSSSYSPLPGHPNYEPMREALRDLFEATQRDGVVSFDYETEIYWGEV